MSQDIFGYMSLDVSIYFYVSASNISEYLWILGIIDVYRCLRMSMNYYWELFI